MSINTFARDLCASRFVAARDQLLSFSGADLSNEIASRDGQTTCSRLGEGWYASPGGVSYYSTYLMADSWTASEQRGRRKMAEHVAFGICLPVECLEVPSWHVGSIMLDLLPASFLKKVLRSAQPGPPWHGLTAVLRPYTLRRASCIRQSKAHLGNLSVIGTTPLQQVLQALEAGIAGHRGFNYPSWCLISELLQQHYDSPGEEPHHADAEVAVQATLTHWGQRWETPHGNKATRCYPSELFGPRLAFQATLGSDEWPSMVAMQWVKHYLSSAANIDHREHWHSLESGSHWDIDGCLPLAVLNLIVESQKFLIIDDMPRLALESLHLAAVLGIRSAAAFAVTDWWPFDLHDVFWNLARLHRAIRVGMRPQPWHAAPQRLLSPPLCEIKALGNACVCDSRVYVTQRRKWASYCDEGGVRWLPLGSMPVPRPSSRGRAWVLPVTSVLNPFHWVRWLLPAVIYALTSGQHFDEVFGLSDWGATVEWSGVVAIRGLPGLPPSFEVFQWLTGLTPRPLFMSEAASAPHQRLCSCFDEVFVGRGHVHYPIKGAFREQLGRTNVLNSRHVQIVRQKLDQALVARSGITPTQVRTPLQGPWPRGLLFQKPKGFSRWIANLPHVEEVLGKARVCGIALDWHTWSEEAALEPLNTVKAHPMKVMRKHSLVELLTLIRRSSLVVGVHSGLLGWASFMEPGSALVEFLPADYALFDRTRYPEDIQAHVLNRSVVRPLCSGSTLHVDPRAYTDLQAALAGVHHGCIMIRHDSVTVGGVGYTGDVEVPLEELEEQVNVLLRSVGSCAAADSVMDVAGRTK